MKTPAAKKVKTGDVDVKDGIAVFEDYTAGAGAGEDGGGVEYA